MPRGNENCGRLRLIAGKYKSRIIKFLPELAVRPTHDRIRETLFNWLNLYIEDSFCLDLFSGSGALGFEACSRGARDVLMCDSNNKTIQMLKHNKQTLNDTASIIRFYDFHEDSPPLTSKPFDIVFLDPPYSQGLLLSSIRWLIRTNSINDNSLIYFEASCDENLDSIFSLLLPVKHKHTSSIQFGLLQLLT